MKKALDYVSKYQLKSACKDAIRTVISKITQMIFAVLETEIIPSSLHTVVNW